MAAHANFLLFFIFFFHHISTSLSATPNFLPITKDPTTKQYVAQIYHGDSRLPINLVLDLGNPFIWIDCASVNLISTTITSCSMKCSKGKAHGIGTSTSSTCSVNTNCYVLTRNSVTGISAMAELAESVVSVDSVNRAPFLFSCAPAFLLQSLASGARGMLGLGKSPVSLPSQFSELAEKTMFNSKFALCLSSSDGFVLLGNGNSISRSEFVGSLVYTPLFISNQEYFINVKSIKINGKKLSVEKSRFSLDEHGKGRTRLSTTVPYTTMESSIYAQFINGYAKAAVNMTRVAAVAPFGLCFRSEELDGLVPGIDFVLQSEMVKWRMNRANFMVRVSNEVMCLGIVDGGVEQENSIVIGGMQLEERFLEFDVDGLRLGLSSGGASCANLGTNYRGKESQ